MKAFLILVILDIIISSGFCLGSFYNQISLGDYLGISSNHRKTNEAKNSTRWFTQILDHFDVSNQNTWQQRYFVNDEFFDKSKRDVAFVWIGGEGEIWDMWMTNGDWIKKAKENNAILFQLEHRFYGESHPTKDLSVDNLKYLTSEHALADLSVFVAAMNKEYMLSPRVKWIAFGGSYAGSLAAWARLKYPHLIHGAVSSSAPLNSVVDFQDYFGVVAENLRSKSDDCYAAVQKSTAQIDALMGQKSGQETLTKLFQLCDPLSEKSDNDISIFYRSLSAYFTGPVCDIMTNSSLGDEVHRVAKYYDSMLKASNLPCFDINYDGTIEKIRNTSFKSSTELPMRQWTFQTCNEFGWFPTSNKKPQIFGNKFPTEFFVQNCMDIFGPEFNATYLDRATRRTNILYGGFDIKVNNVVFVHGSLDPWHALGITTTINEGAPAIFINGTDHCADMSPSLENDPPQLKAARVEIGEHIQTWLDL